MPPLTTRWSTLSSDIPQPLTRLVQLYDMDTYNTVHSVYSQHMDILAQAVWKPGIHRSPQ